MGYVQAGYSIVLAILFLYALTLVLRRRRLTRAVALLVDGTAGRRAASVPGRRRPWPTTASPAGAAPARRPGHEPVAPDPMPGGTS